MVELSPMLGKQFVQMSLRGDILDRAANSIANSADRQRHEQVKIGRSVKYYLEKALKQEIPKSKPPIRWKSERQRIAAIRRMKAMGNYPYVRTGDLQRGWRIEFRVQRFDGVITASNHVPYSRYVNGEGWQQPFHEDTGHIVAEPIMRRAEDEWMGRSAAAWFVGDLR